MHQSRYKNRTEIFILLLAVFVFQDLIQTYVPPLKVADELYALLLLPLLLPRLAEQEFKYTFSKKLLSALLLLTLFWTVGWISTFLHRYQPAGTAIRDSYVAVKFFMAIATSYFLFDGCDFQDVRRKVWPFLNTITIALFILCLLDIAFTLFPTTEYRFGVRSIRLFYSAYTVMAAQSCFLASIYMRLYEDYGKKVQPYLLMLAFLMLSTLRMKAICAILVMFFLYMIVCRRRRQMGFLSWSALGSAALLIAARQFLYYFGELKNESARAMLTAVSFRIAKANFPFGTGWGTYGSAFSIDPYSPVYYRYHLDRVWGLSPRYHSFVSDTFWPMLLGECGWLGMTLYIVVLLMLIHSVFMLGKRNAYSLASGLMPLIYLFISSTSESAFVNTFAVPMAFWLGFLFAENVAANQTAV